MAQVEIYLFWAALFIYVCGFCLLLFGFTGRKDRGIELAFRLLWVGLAVHTAAGITHWIASGHAPVTDTYELNLTGTWFTMLMLLVFEKLRKLPPAIALVVIPVSFLVLGYGYMSGIQINPMGPAFQSPWLVVHVIFAWLAFGGYAIATGAALLLLFSMRPNATPHPEIPAPEILDISSYRFVVLGFINHAIMLVSGAIWAKKLWGHYWSWDALETWSLIAFLYYAIYLHTRSFLGWKMKRAAWIALLGLLVLAISFWGVKWFSPSVHPGP